jgi:hypothetical protein
MDIHKPKPWHNIREFLKEIGTIVIGVLIALGAEQAVEWLHWRHQTELAHQALAYDMKRVMGWAGQMDVQGPCIDTRLAELDAILDKAQESERLPPLGPIARPALASWNLRAWSSLTYGQTLAHMPNGEQTRLAGMARLVDWLFTANNDITEHWSRLERMSGLGRRTNDAEIAAIRETIASERGWAERRRGGARLAEGFVVDTGLLTKAEIDKAWKQGLEAGARGAICKPIPPVSQLSLLSQHLREPVARPGVETPQDVGVRGESLK